MDALNRAQPDCRSVLDWGVAARCLPGLPVSGDGHLVQPHAHGVLVAVVDGLGHGSEAAAATIVALRTLRENAGEPLADLVRVCHQQLRSTRGAVMSLASVSSTGSELDWLGVGNVEGVVLDQTGKREHILLRGGVVGYQLPTLRTQHVAFSDDATLIFATDGIAGSFFQDLPADLAPQALADHVLARHGKDTDDALILVARYPRVKP